MPCSGILQCVVNCSSHLVTSSGTSTVPSCYVMKHRLAIYPFTFLFLFVSNFICKGVIAQRISFLSSCGCTVFSLRSIGVRFLSWRQKNPFKIKRCHLQAMTFVLLLCSFANPCYSIQNSHLWLLSWFYFFFLLVFRVCNNCCAYRWVENEW